MSYKRFKDKSTNIVKITPNPIPTERISKFKRHILIYKNDTDAIEEYRVNVINIKSCCTIL